MTSQNDVTQVKNENSSEVTAEKVIYSGLTYQDLRDELAAF